MFDSEEKKSACDTSHESAIQTFSNDIKRKSHWQLREKNYKKEIYIYICFE